jgi:hypothetical protein
MFPIMPAATTRRLCADFISPPVFARPTFVSRGVSLVDSLMTFNTMSSSPNARAASCAIVLQKLDAGVPPLLPRRRDRPCCRAAEQRDELTTPHVLPSAEDRTLPRESCIVHHSKLECRLAALGQTQK